MDDLKSDEGPDAVQNLALYTWLNFEQHLTVLSATLVCIFLKYAYTGRCQNGYFVRHKPMGNDTYKVHRNISYIKFIVPPLHKKTMGLHYIVSRAMTAPAVMLVY